MLLVAFALAAEPVGARLPSATDPARAPAPARNLSAEAGIGLGLLGGGNGNGYAIGGSQRLGLDIPAGRIHSVVIAVEHAHHVLADSRAYLPDETVPGDAMEGSRDRVQMTLGGRFQLQLADPAADRLVVEPLIEVGMGFVATHTVVEMPSFAGRMQLGSWNVAPALDLGLGADVRVRRFLAFVPALRVTTALEQDPPEDGGRSVFGAEVRGDVSVSARIVF